jgi:predicted RND superfamily exporter protein
MHSYSEDRQEATQLGKNQITFLASLGLFCFFAFNFICFLKLLKEIKKRKEAKKAQRRKEKSIYSNCYIGMFLLRRGWSYCLLVPIM